MPKYIDVDALGIGKANPEIFEHPEYAHGWNSAVEIVLNAPAADVVPVRHGRWNEYDDDYGSISCSVCENDAPNDIPWDYCPHCGARMDGDAL